MLRLIAFLLLPFLLLAATPAAAQPEPGPALKQRAEQLVAILAGKDDATTFFASGFLAQIPLAQVRAIATSLTDQNGAAQRVERIAAESSHIATVEIGYERAIVTVRLVLDPAKPNLVTGFLITGSVARDDSLEKLLADIAALPGTASFAMAELGAGPPRWIARHRPDAQMAVGSIFKLYVLAELSRQVRAGARAWANVAPLGNRSLAAGITQKWPERAPMTLHSLATLMISISDNTATDTLIDVLGRDHVGAMLIDSGHANPARALPMLKTVEAFSLKMPANDALRRDWERGDRTARARLLADNAGRLRIESIDFAKLGSTPTHIDSVEWFASAQDMVAILNTLRTDPAPEARDMLAVNSGVDALTAARFPYIGFKNGLESGVVAASYLVRDRRNRWFAVTGAWNDTKQDVNIPRFNALMLRALALVAR